MDEWMEMINEQKEKSLMNVAIYGSIYDQIDMDFYFKTPLRRS